MIMTNTQDVAGLYRKAGRVFYHAEMLVLCDRTL